MALFYECMLSCARKLLDTADIVRDAMFQQPPFRYGPNSAALIDLPVPQT